MNAQHYGLPLGSELVREIWVTPKNTAYRYYTLYSLGVGEVKKGDIIQACTQFEVTNGLGYNVMVAHAMLINGQETIVYESESKSAGRIVMPCDYAGENVTPGMHHGYRAFAGTVLVDWVGSAWISVVIYAASTAAGARSMLEVNYSYGGLSTVVLRN
ncbi:MAG: hypothetical protein SX243_14760 [Acidobacteriota bacterium]|nr:hypothetical protein [Acidobacteriota bacterium]